MSNSQSTLNPDLFMAIMKLVPSEPSGTTSIITHKESDKEVIMATRGLGTVTDWRKGRNTVLLFSCIEKCMTIAVATLERGLLFHMALTSQERIDQGLDCFRTWWSENKDSFNNGCLYVIMPDWAVFAGAYAKAHALLPEVEKLINLKAKVTSWHNLSEDRAALVWILDEGTESKPVVMYTKKVADPTAPPSSDDSQVVHKMWDEFGSSG